MFTLVLSYLVTCFRNQATKLFLVAALRSKLTLGTIRNFTTLAGDGNAQGLLDVLQISALDDAPKNSDSGFLSFQRRSGPQQLSPLQVRLHPTQVIVSRRSPAFE